MSFDTVVQLDGRPITGVDDLIRALNGEQIDRVVTIEVLRRGQLRSFDVKPLERPAFALAASAR